MSRKPHIIAVLAAIAMLVSLPYSKCMGMTNDRDSTNLVDTGLDITYPRLVQGLKLKSGKIFTHVEYSNHEKEIQDSLNEIRRHEGSNRAGREIYMAKAEGILLEILGRIQEICERYPLPAGDPTKRITYRIIIMEGGSVFRVIYCLKEPELERDFIFAVDSMIRSVKFPDPKQYKNSFDALDGVFRRRGPLDTAETRIRTHREGSLESLLTPMQQDTVTNLAIEGPINSADIRLLRRMAGYCEKEGDKTGRLRVLNLKDACIMADKEPYMVLDAAKEGLEITSKRHPSQVQAPTVMDRVGKNRKSADDDYENWYLIRHDGPYNRHLLIKEADQDIRLAIGEEGDTEKIRKLVQSRNMDRVKGHRLKWEADRALLLCYTQKGWFPMDLFYKCPRLDAVTIPQDAKINDRGQVFYDAIWYFRFNEKGIKERLVIPPFYEYILAK